MTETFAKGRAAARLEPAPPADSPKLINLFLLLLLSLAYITISSSPPSDPIAFTSSVTAAMATRDVILVDYGSASRGRRYRVKAPRGFVFGMAGESGAIARVPRRCCRREGSLRLNTG